MHREKSLRDSRKEKKREKENEVFADDSFAFPRSRTTSPRGFAKQPRGADGRRNARQARGNADVGRGPLACLPRRSRRRGAIIRSSLIKLREMSKDSAMPGKTDNADADYYIPRRPIHSRVARARVCVHAGLPGRGMCAAPGVCVHARSSGARVCMDTYVISPAVTCIRLRYARALSLQLETSVNILHLVSTFAYSFLPPAVYN